MCLNVIKRKYKKAQSGTGWKVFFTPVDGSSDYHFMYRQYMGEMLVPTGQWLKAENRCTLYDPHGNPYNTGFHIYRERILIPRGCQQKVVKVQFRGGHTLGRDGGVPTIVADEMFVPKRKVAKKKKTTKKN